MTPGAPVRVLRLRWCSQLCHDRLLDQTHGVDEPLDHFVKLVVSAREGRGEQNLVAGVAVGSRMGRGNQQPALAGDVVDKGRRVELVGQEGFAVAWSDQRNAEQKVASADLADSVEASTPPL